MSRTIIASAEKTLHIGKQGENLATIVSFADILEKWVAEFGNGSLSLAFQRAEDEAPYLVPLNNAEWTVTSADLAQAGTGLCELIYTVDGIVKKSLRWRTCTLNSLGFTVDPPEPWQAYIDTVISKVAEVENMTVSSETLDASSEATVEKTVGDAVNLHFGIPKGFDGFSPAVSVAQTSTGHIISITDATGTKTVAVDNGAKGDDGFSPSVTLEAIEDGTAIIITDAEGDKRFEVHNGSDASVTAENIRNALDYTPADNAKAMEYKVLTFDGTVFKDSDGNTLTFSQIKTLCLDTKNFVYALYSNRLYIPQYVSNSNIFFEASYIQSDKPQMHRISISSSNAVTQYDMMLATESSVSTLKADLTALTELVGDDPASEESGLELLQTVSDSIELYGALVGIIENLPSDESAREVIYELDKGNDILSSIAEVM